MDINEILAKLPPAPAGVESWIRKELVNNTYLIYNKKENKVVCTRCGHTYRADRFYIKRNLEGECPRCHNKGTYKPSGVGRNNLEEVFRVLIFTHRGQTVYGTLFDVRIRFYPFGKPELSRWLSAVYVFSETERAYYKHRAGWYYTPERWEIMNDFRLPGPTQPFTSGLYAPPTHLYTDNIKNVFSKSCLKYLWLPDFMKEHNLSASELIRYMNEGLKYQSIELLIKAGFTNLVAERIRREQTYGCINWRGKNLQKILRLPRQYVRFLRQYNPSIYQLRIVQSLTEKERREASWHDITTLASFNSWRFGELCAIVPLIKWVRWVSKIQRRPTLTDYLDYIENSKKIGIDIRRKDVLFPTDFWAAHDDAAEKAGIETSRKQNEKIKVATFDVSIEKNGLICYMARSQTELNNESSYLNHCVRTYGDKVARGECYIFFIRKTEKKDIPFYTLELDKRGEFRQCRGNRNCGMTEEIEMFVNEFKKDFKKILNLRNKERSAA